jgi:hypothetical protein
LEKSIRGGQSFTYGYSVPVCTPRMAASPSQFLIIVGLFTCYIGTAPELESADRCRAQGLRALALSL